MGHGNVCHVGGSLLSTRAGGGQGTRCVCVCHLRPRCVYVPWPWWSAAADVDGRAGAGRWLRLTGARLGGNGQAQWRWTWQWTWWWTWWCPRMGQLMCAERRRRTSRRPGCADCTTGGSSAGEGLGSQMGDQGPLLLTSRRDPRQLRPPTAELGRKRAGYAKRHAKISRTQPKRVEPPGSQQPAEGAPPSRGASMACCLSRSDRGRRRWQRGQPWRSRCHTRPTTATMDNGRSAAQHSTATSRAARSLRQEAACRVAHTERAESAASGWLRRNTGCSPSSQSRQSRSTPNASSFV